MRYKISAVIYQRKMFQKKLKGSIRYLQRKNEYNRVPNGIHGSGRVT